MMSVRISHGGQMILHAIRCRFCCRQWRPVYSAMPREAPLLFLKTTSVVEYQPAFSLTREHLVRPLSQLENLMQRRSARISHSPVSDFPTWCANNVPSLLAIMWSFSSP